MDQLLALRAFCRVIERRNFTAVARELELSQSTVSRLVGEVEARARVSLLARTTRTVTPTEAGRAYYERVAPALAELAEAMQEAAAQRQVVLGRVRVAAPAAFGRRFVVPALRELLEQHPGLRAEVLLSDLTVDLVAEGVDLAVRVGATGPGTFSQRRLGEARQGLVATRDYLERAGRPGGFADLPRLTWVLCSTTLTAMAELRKAKTMLLPEVDPRYVSDDIDSVADMVRAGMGVSVLPLWMVSEQLARGEFEQILPTLPIPAPPIVALHHSGRRLPRRARLLLDRIGAHLEAEPTTRSAHV